MSYRYTYRPSTFGYNANRRLGFRGLYGDDASRRRLYAGYSWRGGRIPGARRLAARRRFPTYMNKVPATRTRRFRPGFDRTGGAYKRALYNPNASLPEVKNIDLINTVALTMANPMLVSSSAFNGGFFVGIAQATNDFNRIGRKICVKSVHLRGNVQFIPTALSDGWDRAVIMVVLDTQANGAFPAPGDIMASTNPSAFLLNLDNTSRFRILKTWSQDFNVNTLAVSGNQFAPQIAHVDLYVPCNTEVNYSGTIGAITEIRDNNIFIIYGSSQTLCEFNGSSRVRFTDA